LLLFPAIGRELIGLCFNKFLENFDLCNLRVSKVHHLIEQFVGDHEVVTQTLIFKLFKVIFENSLELVEVSEHESNIWISPRDRNDVDIVNTNPNESHVAISEHWLESALIEFKNLPLETLSDSAVHVTTIVT
jgi:hypothetical protein